jgi:hypothetical protein
MSPEMADDQMTVEQWLAIRKEAALHIDPETAEVEWAYAQEMDPYGVHPDLPEEFQTVGRKSYARSPRCLLCHGLVSVLRSSRIPLVEGRW